MNMVANSHQKNKYQRNKFFASLTLLRPWNNLLLEFALVTSAAILATGWSVPLGIPLLILIISSSLAMMAGTVLDDIADFDMDKIINKKRPLAQGLLSVKEAWLIWAITSLLCISLGFVLGLIPFVGMILAIILGVFYAFWPRLKDYFIINELTIGLLFFIEIVVTSVYFSGQITREIWYLSSFIFVGVFSARSLQGFLDFKYDDTNNKRSLQTALGFKKTSIFLLMINILAYGFFIPFFYLDVFTSTIFLVTMLLFFVISIFAVVLTLAKNSKRTYYFSYQLGKIYSLGISWSIIITYLIPAM